MELGDTDATGSQLVDRCFLLLPVREMRTLYFKAGLAGITESGFDC